MATDMVHQFVKDQLVQRGTKKWRRVAETLRPVYDAWHTVSRTADVTSTDAMRRPGMARGPHFDWIPTSLRPRLHDHDHHFYYYYTFPCGHRTVHLYLHPLASTHDPAEVVRLAWTWLQTLDRLVGRKVRNECSPDLSIYLYLSNARKEWPVAVEGEGGAKAALNLKEEHVNSGFTVACGRPHNAIYVFREEEWFKVLIHETMHAFGLDYASAPGSNAHDHAFEAYSECWAEWIAATVRLHEYGPGHRAKMDPTALARYLEMEERWAQQQGGRIWAWFDGDEDRLRRHEPYVFDYYVLKHVLMAHGDAFVAWCAAHHLPDAPVFVFDPAHLPQFQTWLKARYAETPMPIKEGSKNAGLQKDSDNSLRMSLWGD